MRICSIEKQKWLVFLLLRCFWESKKQSKNRFILKSAGDLLKLQSVKPDFNMKDYFQLIQDVGFISPGEGHCSLANSQKSDQQIIKSIRICSIQGFANSIFISEDMLMNVDQFFKHLDILSSDQIFSSELNIEEELNEEKIKENYFGKWFTITSANLIAQIYVAFLERNIYMK